MRGRGEVGAGGGRRAALSRPKGHRRVISTCMYIRVERFRLGLRFCFWFCFGFGFGFGYGFGFVLGFVLVRFGCGWFWFGLRR